MNTTELVHSSYVADTTKKILALKDRITALEGLICLADTMRDDFVETLECEGCRPGKSVENYDVARLTVFVE